MNKQEMIKWTEGHKLESFEAGKEKGLEWSGEYTPFIGQRVGINFNGLETGIVTGFFELEGYIGITVQLENQPEWHKNQNYNGCPATLFGAETKAIE